MAASSCRRPRRNSHHRRSFSFLLNPSPCRVWSLPLLWYVLDQGFLILNNLQTYSCRMNDSIFCCPEEYRCELLRWTRAVTAVDPSEVQLMLRLRLRQRSVLRPGREGVRGSSFMRPEVRDHQPVS